MTLRIISDDMMAEAGGTIVQCSYGSYYETRSADCGCPEAGFCDTQTGLAVLVHFEPDGSGEVYVENEDGWSCEWAVLAPSLPDLVVAALDRIDAEIVTRV